MDLYGIIGNPLGHSFSRAFFTEKFQREGIDAQYLSFEIPQAMILKEIISENPKLRGLNVTLPFKTDVIPLLDQLDPEAREIGAVNVIRISGGKTKGFNSDVIGFTESLRPLLKPHHRRALILGTGGASRAVRAGLNRLGVVWTYVSRTSHEGALSYEQLNAQIMQENTLIVNCTPVGMYPHVDVCPQIPYEHLTSQHLLFDLIYNPEQTLFLRRGAVQGATTKNGLEMLHLQAVAGWEIWNNPSL